MLGFTVRFSIRPVATLWLSPSACQRITTSDVLRRTLASVNGLAAYASITTKTQNGAASKKFGMSRWTTSNPLSHRVFVLRQMAQRFGICLSRCGLTES